MPWREHSVSTKCLIRASGELMACSLRHTVRRLGAVLLVLLFVAAPVLSALAGTSVSSDLPACCKKDGAHMCSVRRTRASQNGQKPRLSAVCPFASQSGPAVLAQPIGTSHSTLSTAARAFEEQRIAHSQVFATAGIPLLGNPKRGPPLTFF